MSLETETPLRVDCPVCNRDFPANAIEEHVNRCLFLSTPSSKPSAINPAAASGKRQSTLFLSPPDKKQRVAVARELERKTTNEQTQRSDQRRKSLTDGGSDEEFVCTPLAELMRPASLETYVGQKHVLGENQILRQLLERGDVPSVILWGPPGCGKTSLANVVAAMCRQRSDMRFVKLSAAMAGIADVKEVVAQAKNEIKFKRKTVLFMDEIHRFNKLQQDAFLPHVESGALILMGATTENPSFSLNSALLSRCRVVVLDKLSVEDVTTILERALEYGGLRARVVDPGGGLQQYQQLEEMPRVLVERASLVWLAEVCDGDARVALGGLQLAVRACTPDPNAAAPQILTLEHVKEGIKRSHTLYSRTGDQHYDMISALHKSVRASDDTAALYWVTRMLRGGEDPLYIARRLVRAASEDIGLADSSALPLAVACLQGCQHVGMPECDVILAHCTVYLARAPKSQEVYRALLAAQSHVDQYPGPLPAVPLHLRNAPTKLMKNLGCGAGYNTQHRDQSQLNYLPQEIEGVEFFHESSS